MRNNEIINFYIKEREILIRIYMYDGTYKHTYSTSDNNRTNELVEVSKWSIILNNISYVNPCNSIN